MGKLNEYDKNALIDIITRSATMNELITDFMECCEKLAGSEKDDVIEGLKAIKHVYPDTKLIIIKPSASQGAQDSEKSWLYLKDAKQIYLDTVGNICLDMS